MELKCSYVDKIWYRQWKKKLYLLPTGGAAVPSRPRFLCPWYDLIMRWWWVKVTSSQQHDSNTSTVMWVVVSRITQHLNMNMHTQCSCHVKKKFKVNYWMYSWSTSADWAHFSLRPTVWVMPIEAASLFAGKMNPQGTWPGTLLCMQCVARFKLAINYPIKTDRNAHQEFHPISPCFWLEHD